MTGRAPVWRAGANATTRLKTEVDLEIGGTRVPAGEYSLFIDLAEGSWTAILSRQPSMETYDRAKIDDGITWGAYGYDPELDVVRAPMELSPLGLSVDQMTIFFADVSEAGGQLGLAWGNQLALLSFGVAGDG